MKTPTDSLGKQLSTFTSPNNNLQQILDKEVLEPTGFSVKGALIHDSKLWITASHKRIVESQTCWNTSIFVSPLDSSRESLNFELFYSPDECPSKKVEFEDHQAGGFLVPINGELISRDSGDYLLFSHGDYRARYLAQEEGSVFGSIVAVNTEDSTDTIILAKGLRNPQGATLVDERIFFVEQGPQGGDEINVVDLAKDKFPINFGWPISSYGDNYGRNLKAEAPSLDSHSEYGFKEPVFFWNPSVAPSSIAHFTHNSSKRILVGTLGNKPLEGDQSLHFFSQSKYSDVRLTLEDFINLETRVRDLLIYKNLIISYSDKGELIVIPLTK